MKTLSQICLAFVLLGGLLAQNALAKPPHNPHFNTTNPHKANHLPQIKDIAYEIFVSASEDKQIKALQIEADYREKMRKNTQKLRDERHKLELEKKILQVKFHHAKDDEKQVQTLLTQIHKNEEALFANHQSQKALHDKLIQQKIEDIYKALR